MNRPLNCFRPLPGGIAKFTVAMGIVLACVPGTRADYLSDRKAAMELVQAGKHEDALSAFLKMADNTASHVQKSDALEQAAMRAQSLKRCDQALELARRIPLVPAAKTVQMCLHRYWRGRMLTTYGNLLAQQGKRAEAIAKYREAVHLQDLLPAQKIAYETALKDLTKAEAK